MTRCQGWQRSPPLSRPVTAQAFTPVQQFFPGWFMWAFTDAFCFDYLITETNDCQLYLMSQQMCCETFKALFCARTLWVGGVFTLEKVFVTLTATLLRDAWQRMKTGNKKKLLLNAGFKGFYRHGASVFRFHFVDLPICGGALWAVTTCWWMCEGESTVFTVSHVSCSLSSLGAGFSTFGP